MIIDGRKFASDKLRELKPEVAGLPFEPLFCDVIVGSDPVSMSYVKIKGKSAEQIGMGFKMFHFPESVSQQYLVEEIKKINFLPNICGLIVQLPLPKKFNGREILDAIDPNIDVDCIGSIRSGQFYRGDLGIIPPTAAAVVALLDSLRLDLATQNILVVGQGALVGRPVSYLIKLRGLDINIADIDTKNPETLLKNADVIISATGQKQLITGEKIKPGCVVIDAGTSESGGGIVGDADFGSVSKVAAYISPVPGGVGPVTVSMLLKNVFLVAKGKL
ncbi:MAG: hypothetical protein COT92_00015 [Candidatus Doudnabacteria bacterium CG10_big_fil_rev_8_21_14_0_10_42_18]|uniref:Bifunctional protein FolD n=1 Tax=Candidatus Doudnabacteria bacterium CG10_big_fil_rev_8_21_14_0_10_42_18 TaxID=1974552 RepID=A0A2H0VC14_9BACT|nr:MAG: hypothetical protein COT92_00015 [Candidatus Doudnabacteria bacterium CG10_big_fil_rev_8_21_14_0_10_42_18]